METIGTWRQEVRDKRSERAATVFRQHSVHEKSLIWVSKSIVVGPADLAQ